MGIPFHEDFGQTAPAGKSGKHVFLAFGKILQIRLFQQSDCRQVCGNPGSGRGRYLKISVEMEIFPHQNGFRSLVFLNGRLRHSEREQIHLHHCHCAVLSVGFCQKGARRSRAHPVARRSDRQTTERDYLNNLSLDKKRYEVVRWLRLNSEEQLKFY